MVRLVVLVQLRRPLQDMLTQLERQLWRRPAIVQHMIVQPQSPVLAHLTVVPALAVDPAAAAAAVAVTGHRGQRDQPQMPAILTRCQHSLLPWPHRVDLRFSQLSHPPFRLRLDLNSNIKGCPIRWLVLSHLLQCRFSLSRSRVLLLCLVWPESLYVLRIVRF